MPIRVKKVILKAATFHIRGIKQLERTKQKLLQTDTKALAKD